MALINCPECGKEVSDKANVCIHCGYPLDEIEVKEEEKKVPNIDGYLQNIQSTFNSFMSNPDLYEKNMGGIYPSVKVQIDNIYNEVDGCEKDVMREINDKVALTILDITKKGGYYCSWKTYKNFYEFVKFDNISNGVLKNIADFVYEKISYVEHFSDGSSGNSEHIMLWYPIHQILTYGTEDLKKPILENLSLLNAFRSKRYDDVQSMVNQHLYGDSSEIIQPQTTSFTQTVNVPKCPTCGSTKIKKISGLSKAGSVAMWGIFSRKVHKQWHCDNCGSEW